MRTKSHQRLFRVSRLVVIVGSLALSGCANGEKLAEAKGPLFPLNPDHWQASPQDLKAPPAGRER